MPCRIAELTTTCEEYRELNETSEQRFADLQTFMKASMPCGSALCPFPPASQRPLRAGTGVDATGGMLLRLRAVGHALHAHPAKVQSRPLSHWHCARRVGKGSGLGLRLEFVVVVVVVVLVVLVVVVIVAAVVGFFRPSC